MTGNLTTDYDPLSLNNIKKEIGKRKGTSLPVRHHTRSERGMLSFSLTYQGKFVAYLASVLMLELTAIGGTGGAVISKRLLLFPLSLGIFTRLPCGSRKGSSLPVYRHVQSGEGMLSFASIFEGKFVFHLASALMPELSAIGGVCGAAISRRLLLFPRSLSIFTSLLYGGEKGRSLLVHHYTSSAQGMPSFPSACPGKFVVWFSPVFMLEASAIGDARDAGGAAISRRLLLPSWSLSFFTSLLCAR